VNATRRPAGAAANSNSNSNSNSNEGTSMRRQLQRLAAERGDVPGWVLIAFHI
jgi:hypothetical protein